jgi:Uma2 family endonuclease
MATATQVEHTPEELLEITDRPMPELIDGQFVERPPMGQKADAEAFRIGRLIGNFVDDHQLGVVNGSQGSFQIFPDAPKKVRIPDVSFTRWERLPGGQSEEGHGTIAPDLAVEVISPNDLAVDVVAKVHEFLNAGVTLVWVANPDTRDLLVYRSDRPGTHLRSSDILEGDDVLPGFQCLVAELFKIRAPERTTDPPRRE